MSGFGRCSVFGECRQGLWDRDGNLMWTKVVTLTDSVLFVSIPYFLHNPPPPRFNLEIMILITALHYTYEFKIKPGWWWVVGERR